MTTIYVQADASESLGYSLPFADISYLNFFTSPAVLRRNLASPADLSAMVGAPTVTNGRLRAKSRTNYIRTTVAQPPVAGTLIAAARCIDDGSTLALAPRFISGYKGGTLSDGSVGLLPRAAGTMSGLLTLNNGGAYLGHWTDQPSTITSWAIWAFRWSASATRVDNLTAGTRKDATVTSPVDVSTSRLCIGSDALTGGTSFLGESEIASACIASRFLTDPELQSIAGRMRTAAARVGISL